MNDLDLCLEVVQGRSRQPLRRQHLQNYLSCRLQIWYTALYGEWWAGVKKNSPNSGRGLGRVTIGVRSNTSWKLFDLVTSNLARSFDLRLLFDCRLLHILREAVRSAILATAWLLVPLKRTGRVFEWMSDGTLSMCASRLTPVPVSPVCGWRSMRQVHRSLVALV